MRSVANWPASFSVSQPTVRVLLDGVETDVLAVSWEASTHGLSPSGSSAARTGRIDWAPRSVVETKSAWLPKRGQRIEVWQGYGSAQTRVFYGKVRKSARNLTSCTSEIVDDFDRLSAPVTIDPAMFMMPTWNADGQRDKIRYPGMMSSWVVQQAAARARFYATPPAMSGSHFAASLNGSLLPEAGFLTDTGPDWPAEWRRTTWGVAPRGYTASYSALGATYGTMTIHCMISALGNSGELWSITGGNGVWLSINGGGWATLLGPAGQIAQMPVTSATTQIRATWEPSGTYNLERYDGNTLGYAIAGTTAAVPSPPTTWDISSSATGPVVGGVTVTYAATYRPWFTPNFLMDAPPSLAGMRATRSIINASARSVLDEAAAAESASYWIDSDGILRWRNRTNMTTGSPVTTLTGADSLLDMGLSSDWDGNASSVTVKYATVFVTAKTYSSITCWQGSGESLEAGDVSDQIVHPGADEEWVQVDTTLDVLGVDDPAGFSRRQRSWDGAVAVAKEKTTVDGVTYEANSEYVDTVRHTTTLNRLDARSYRFRTSIVSDVPPTFQVVMRAPDRDQWAGIGVVSKALSAEKTPILRSYGRSTFMQSSLTSTITGPTDMPAFVLDAGWWLQDATQARSLADFWAGRLCNPSLSLPDLPIIPDARLELGDIVKVSEQDRTGVEATVVITGMKCEASPGRAAHTISVDVISMTANDGTTYDELQAANADSTYTQWQSTTGAQTYSQYEGSL